MACIIGPSRPRAPQAVAALAGAALVEVHYVVQPLYTLAALCPGALLVAAGAGHHALPAAPLLALAGAALALVALCWAFWWGAHARAPRARHAPPVPSVARATCAPLPRLVRHPPRIAQAARQCCH